MRYYSFHSLSHSIRGGIWSSTRYINSYRYIYISINDLNVSIRASIYIYPPPFTYLSYRDRKCNIAHNGKEGNEWIPTPKRSKHDRTSQQDLEDDIYIYYNEKENDKFIEFSTNKQTNKQTDRRWKIRFILEGEVPLI